MFRCPAQLAVGIYSPAAARLVEGAGPRSGILRMISTIPRIRAARPGNETSLGNESHGSPVGNRAAARIQYQGSQVRLTRAVCRQNERIRGKRYGYCRSRSQINAHASLNVTVRRHDRRRPRVQSRMERRHCPPVRSDGRSANDSATDGREEDRRSLGYRVAVAVRHKRDCAGCVTVIRK